MKITKSQLKQIIKEELARSFLENNKDDWGSEPAVQLEPVPIIVTPESALQKAEKIYDLLTSPGLTTATNPEILKKNLRAAKENLDFLIDELKYLFTKHIKEK